MKLIVGTNILLNALIKDSRVRAILLSPVDQFLVPDWEPAFTGLSFTRPPMRLLDVSIERYVGLWLGFAVGGGGWAS